jgi:Ca2+-binding RTX toxin-like protein
MGPTPNIETLEDRRLFSISFSKHVLNVIGVPKSPDTITVGLLPGGAAVYATLSYPTKKAPYSLTKDFPLTSSIHLVNIGGGNLSDLITIDQTNGSFPIVTHINTHNGNDTVMGGDEPDKITCGSGIDAVMSGNGNDSLYAGHGPDSLVAGDGNDVLHGGPGHDLLFGGNGNDTFIDPSGHTTLHGGTGHDTYVLKSIFLDPDNNFTPSKDTLKKYVPPSNSDSLTDQILNGLQEAAPFL